MLIEECAIALIYLNPISPCLKLMHFNVLFTLPVLGRATIALACKNM